MWVRIAGAIAVVIFLWMVGRFWHPVYRFTEFLQLDAANEPSRIPEFREFPVYVYKIPGSYDGQFYAQIAYHPLLQSPELRLAIDNLPYRARRILPAMLSWLAAAGHPASIVYIYSAINIAAWLALALVLWRLLPVSDGYSTGAWLGVLFAAGSLASVRLALTDLVALALVGSAMLASERKHAGLGSGLLAVAGLARETSLLALPAVLNRPLMSRFNLVRFLATVAPLALWVAYVRWQVGSGNQGWENFSWPFAGWLGKWRASITALANLSDPLVPWTTFLATIGITIQAIYILKRPQTEDRWWRLGMANVVLMAFLSKFVWQDFPGAVFRVVLPLTLAFNVLIVRRRAALSWLLAGNLTVFSGLLLFRDVPFDNRDIVATRASGSAILVRQGPGWFDSERTRSHFWAWSTDSASLEIQKWPDDHQAMTMAFSMRSLIPRVVTIQQGSSICWHGEVGTTPIPIRISVTMNTGRTELRFSTPTPGVPENASDGARLLAFALYDPKIIPEGDLP
jgi:hypothetical protein